MNAADLIVGGLWALVNALLIAGIGTAHTLDIPKWGLILAHFKNRSAGNKLAVLKRADAWERLLYS